MIYGSSARGMRESAGARRPQNADGLAANKISCNDPRSDDSPGIGQGKGSGTRSIAIVFKNSSPRVPVCALTLGPGLEKRLFRAIGG